MVYLYFVARLEHAIEMCHQEYDQSVNYFYDTGATQKIQLQQNVCGFAVIRSYHLSHIFINDKNKQGIFKTISHLWIKH